MVDKGKEIHLGTMNIYKISLMSSSFIFCVISNVLVIIKYIKNTERHNQGQSVHEAYQT